MSYEAPTLHDGTLDWEQIKDDLDAVVKAATSVLHDGGLANGFVLLYSSVQLPDDPSEPTGYMLDYYCNPDLDFARAAGMLMVCDAKFRARMTGYILRDQEGGEE